MKFVYVNIRVVEFVASCWCEGGHWYKSCMRSCCRQSAIFRAMNASLGCCIETWYMLMQSCSSTGPSRLCTYVRSGHCVKSKVFWSSITSGQKTWFTSYDMCFKPSLSWSVYLRIKTKVCLSSHNIACLCIWRCWSEAVFRSFLIVRSRSYTRVWTVSVPCHGSCKWIFSEIQQRVLVCWTLSHAHHRLLDRHKARFDQVTGDWVTSTSTFLSSGK